jgi:hypothetical protein
VKNGSAYSLYYEDHMRSDGSLRSRRVRRLIGRLSDMSERSARREHERIMQAVNRSRGSIQTPVTGQTFNDLVKAYQTTIAPHLSPATVRQRESYLRTHIIPKFGDLAPDVLDVPAIQQFATDLRHKLTRKTVINVLGTIFAILRYAQRCNLRVPNTSFKDLELGISTTDTERPFFT